MKSVMAALLAITALLGGSASICADTTPRGGFVSWARMKTPSPHWQRHAEKDHLLVDFIRTNTNLDIEQTWRVADIDALDQLCQYPFLFSEGIHRLTDHQQRANLGEYMQRGGFLFIDSCINTSEVNPDPDAFFNMQVETLRKVLPGVRISAIPHNHPVYSAYFTMEKGLPHSFMRSIPDPEWAKYGLHAVHYEERMVGLLSLSGIQCGWAQLQDDPGHETECMKMMVNIYIHAMTN